MKAGIIGFYGFGNIGDDALLQSTTAMLLNLGVEPYFATFGSKSWKEKLDFPGIAVEIPIKAKGLLGSTQELLMLLKHITNVDFLVVGGGALIHDNTLINPLLFSALSIINRLMNKRGVILGIGASPMKRKTSAIFFKTLKFFDGIAARSSGEAKVIADFYPKVLIASDLVFNMPFREGKRAKPEEPTLAINISSHFTKEEYYRSPSWETLEYRAVKILKALKGFLDDFQIKILPSVQEDWDFAKLLYRRLSEMAGKRGRVTLSLPETPREYLQELASASAVLSMRYHGILFSFLLKLPVFPLIYDFKTSSLLKDLSKEGIELPRASSFDILSPNFFKKFEEFLENLKYYQRSSTKALLFLKKRAEHNRSLLKRVVECAE